MKKSINFFLSIIFILFTPLFFFSCQNFFNGSELTEQLNEKIEWAKIKDPLTIVYTSPSFQSTGITNDSRIEIKFNKSINPQTFNYSINSNNQNFSNYYEAPQFFDNNKIVKIMRNNTIDFGLKSGEVIDITVVINKNLIAADGTKFSKTDYSFNFRLNATKDDLPPTVESLKLLKNPYGLNDTELSQKAYEEWETADYSANHVNSFIVECNARDAGTGPAGVLVTEEYICDTQGNKPSYERKKTKIHNLDFNNESSDSSLYKVHQKIDFTTYDDGIIKLTLQIVDKNENPSEETFVYYVLKDTQFSITEGSSTNQFIPIVLANDKCSAIYAIDDETNTLDASKIIDEKSQTVYFQAYIKDEYFKGMISEKDDFLVKFETGISEESFTCSTTDTTCENFYENSTDPEEITSTQYKAPIKFETPDVENYLKVTVYDKAGNTWSKINKIPKRTQLLSIPKITTGTEAFDDNTILSKDSLFYLYEYEDESINPDKATYTEATGNYYNYFNPFSYPAPDENRTVKKMHVYYQAKYQKGYINSYYIYAPISKRYVFEKDEYEKLRNEDINGPEFDFEYSNKNNLITITVTDTKANNYYDLYYATVKYGKYGSSYQFTMYKKDNAYVGEHTLSDYYMEKTGNNAPVLTVTPVKYGNECSDKSQTKTVTFYYNYDETQDLDENAVLETDTIPNIYYSNNRICISESSSNIKIYYQQDNPILLENLEQISCYETNGQAGVPAYLFDNGIYYFRVEEVTGEKTRKVSKNKRFEIYHENYYKASISTEDIERSISYLQYNSGTQYEGLPASYNKSTQLCTYSSGSYWAEHQEDYNYGRTKDDTVQVYFKPFEFVLTNTKTNEKSTDTYTLNTNIFDGSIWTKDFSESNDRTYWWDKESRYIVNHGRVQASAMNTISMNTIYWDKNWVKVYLIKYDGYNINDDSFSQVYVTNPTYLYLDNLASTPEYPNACKIKNLMDNGYMLTLMCDSPTLVHTLYANRDLGSITNWEAEGITADTQFFSETSNIDVDTSEIPENMYYVTVAWFMDGTNTISGLHQKKTE